MSARIAPVWFYFRTIAVVLLIWWSVSVLLGRPYLLPGPVAVGTEALELAASGELVDALVVSGERLLVAYSLAVAVGVPLGIAMGRIWFVNDLFDWLIEMLRPISGIAWIPILLVVFGISNAIPISIIFIAAVFPIILNAQAGARTVEPNLLGAAEVLGASRLRQVFQVIIPAALPSIITGARIAFSVSWMALIVAELVGAPNGVGYAIGFAQELGRATLVLAWIVYIGIFGYLIDVALRWVQTMLTPWAAGLKVGGTT
jgi:ABC-type nitrate/sulfonate/bicarbonate transport system permease component